MGFGPGGISRDPIGSAPIGAARYLAGASMPWLDASGTPHVFTSTAQFQAFASAIASYVTQLKFGNSPATPLTIA